jgi:hypothetical protein
MVYRLKRHPFAVRARLETVIVLTYALPEVVLRPLLPPGLSLDTWEDYGFVAVAFVKTRALRPASLPGWMGRDFNLCGYRVFSRYRTVEGRTLRGLRILRTDTNRRSMVVAGNLLTHYGYHYARMDLEDSNARLGLSVQSDDGHGDIALTIMNGRVGAGRLPADSPFPDARQARRFAGPMPFTFDYEPQTHAIIRVEGVRGDWRPRLVDARVEALGFLEQPPFAGQRPRLASAYLIEGVDYLWRRGIREPLPSRPVLTPGP